MDLTQLDEDEKRALIRGLDGTVFPGDWLSSVLFGYENRLTNVVYEVTGEIGCLEEWHIEALKERHEILVELTKLFAEDIRQLSWYVGVPIVRPSY